MKTDNILTEETIEAAFLLDHSLCSGAAADVKKGGARSLKAGGLWIYDNEIDRFEGDFEDGDILAVRDFDGYFLGWGFVNRKSRICIRMLSRREEPEVTPSFLKKRVRAAWEYRKKALLPEKEGAGRLGISQKSHRHFFLPGHLWRGGFSARSDGRQI